MDNLNSISPIHIFVILIVFIIIAIILWIIIYGSMDLIYPINRLVETQIDNPIAIYDNEKADMIFPDHEEYESNYEKIRDEYLQLVETDNNTNVWEGFGHGDKSFFKGWKTIPLRLLDIDNIDNMSKCPFTSSLLRKHPYVSTAIFSVLEPGKTLEWHRGPIKGKVRYHLNLLQPKDEQSTLEVNGDYHYISYPREGDYTIFDDTYPHRASNPSKHPRVALLLDIERPLTGIPKMAHTGMKRTLNIINKLRRA